MSRPSSSTSRKITRVDNFLMSKTGNCVFVPRTARKEGKTNERGGNDLAVA